GGDPGRRGGGGGGHHCLVDHSLEMTRIFLFISRAASGAGLALVLAGCSYLGHARSFDPTEFDTAEGWRAVRGVPVLLQRGETDCGPAALGMIFAYWQIRLSQEELM